MRKYGQINSTLSGSLDNVVDWSGAGICSVSEDELYSVRFIVSEADLAVGNFVLKETFHLTERSNGVRTQKLLAGDIVSGGNKVTLENLPALSIWRFPPVVGYASLTLFRVMFIRWPPVAPLASRILSSLSQLKDKTMNTESELCTSNIFYNSFSVPCFNLVSLCLIHSLTAGRVNVDYHFTASG
ncbi:hypothetical protein CBL_11086 [Carabus blaptoides fortunei]